MPANREITLQPGPDGPEPVGVFDLSTAQVEAIAAALAHDRHSRFGVAELSDADRVLALRRLGQVADLIDAHRHGETAIVRLTVAQARAIADAVARYLADRDVPSYQSPEERERIATLAALSEPLRDLAMDLRAAIARLEAGEFPHPLGRA